MLKFSWCLQPLAMDWREKIKAAKGRPAEAPKAVTPKAEPVKYASKPNLEALSVGLPSGWKALWDKQSREIFYGNPTTKVGKAGRCQRALTEAVNHSQTQQASRQRERSEGRLLKSLLRSTSSLCILSLADAFQHGCSRFANTLQSPTG